MRKIARSMTGSTAPTLSLSKEARLRLEFIEQHCTLGGSFRGQRFVPVQFQRDLVADIYREAPDGGRERRAYLLGLPRKNTKSQTAAALAVSHLAWDPFNLSPEVYSAAGDRQQAKIVHGEAKRMILADPWLSSIMRVYRDAIENTKTGGVYRALSADAALQQGLGPAFVVFDEVHVLKNNDLIEALTLGSAMRKSPLFVYITTAGFRMESPLGRLYEYGRLVESGEIDDPTFGFTWYGPKDNEVAGRDYDPGDPDVWKRYNPAWDLMPDPLTEFGAAFRRGPLNAFIRYRLNGWTATESSWLPMGAWASCAISEDPLQPGDTLILGFDGSFKGDATAIVGIRTSDWKLFLLGFWERPANDDDWHVPVLEVKQRILELCSSFDVLEIAADPWFFQETMANLKEMGLPVVDFPTNGTRMFPATAAFYQAVINQHVAHDGDPRLSRHIANCVLKEDERGARVTKESKGSKRHIDAAVAAIIAFYRAVHYAEEAERVSDVLVLGEE